ncbi:restriction endonuclease [Sedimentibacter sp. SX930]|nr:restriction endonuclease [Sedimentibacter sp. SX930]
MNKTAIKNFAVWARRKLISEITYKAGLIGINEKGISQPLSISTGNVQFFDIGTGKPNEISDHEIKQRNALVKRIREKESTSDYKTAFQFVIEEVAYTWFNRLIAIRFMEVNDYLPSRIRVLSSETPAKSEPDIVTTPFDIDMEFSPFENDQIMQLKHENKLDELFRMLFIKQCNKLNEVLPELFEKTADYTELLLNISFTDNDGIVSHLVNDITEDDFTEAVEIIGWMYQYYNTEPKDEVFALLKKKVKITKERIPAATQLFTPDWIVRYMVENSLGRLWVEGHPNENLKAEWRYYLEEADQEDVVMRELEQIRTEYKKLNPEDIKVIDPCMGSGHILIYAFEVLMQIYESQGYTQRDAASAIIENNLYGLDIDDRAYQLAYFAVMMKARKYDRRFLTRAITPTLYSIKESNGINKDHLQYFGHSLNDTERKMAIQQIEYLMDAFYDATEYGSILNINKCNWELLRQFVEDLQIEGQISLDSIGVEDSQKNLIEIIAIGETLAYKYDVVITNPPYMGLNGGNSKINNYVKKTYPDSKSDLFSVFIEKCIQISKKNSLIAMITQQSWMFLSSFEKLRLKMLLLTDTINMAHLGARAFEEIAGEVVQTTAWIQRKSNINKYQAVYARLVDFNSQQSKEKGFLSRDNIFITSKEKFSKIPGTPSAYWASEKLFIAYENELVIDGCDIKQGLATCNNALFVRDWSEVNFENVGLNYGDAESAYRSNKKWFPYNKGGGFRKWYGNNYSVVNWKNNGEDIHKYSNLPLDFNGAPVRAKRFYFKEGITYGLISSTAFSARSIDGGFVFDVGGSMIFPEKYDKYYLLALFSTKVTQYILGMINPTLNYQVGDIGKVPVIIDREHYDRILLLSKLSVKISKFDWDSFERSWEFKRHPLIDGNNKVQEAFEKWKGKCDEQLNKLKASEEELNRIFIDIYGLQNELTPEVEDKNLTVQKADLQRDIKSFLSYAVGCMFGRYSLDIEDLAFAGGDWDQSNYTTFIPDKDNCILITDEEYFGDDIVGRFAEFVKCVYGIEALEENLDFIAKALGNKGDTSREIIRNYFIKDFYKDHVKTYQKRPIYWLYDSGKQDGFKGLVYMHRYTADTTGIIRVDYLHKMQKIYMSEIDRMIDTEENSNNAREIVQAEKRKEKLVKQLKETKEYDEKIAHLAISRIAIDLDDGVKLNYEKIQTGQDGNKLDILGKI